MQRLMTAMIVAAMVFQILNPMIALAQTSITLAANADQLAFTVNK
jgi:hypothetical protein